MHQIILLAILTAIHFHQDKHTLVEHVELKGQKTTDHEVLTAPIFTQGAYVVADGPDSFLHCGLSGSILDDR